MDSLLSNVRSGGKEERNRTAGGPYVRALRMKKDYDWEDVMNGKFLLGAATAAHQVEGNNIYSDFWALEQMENSSYKEPSLDAVDHYHRYEEDIRLLKEAGLNAFRFSIEWARIEPVKGKYEEAEIEHYRKILDCCHENGIVPVVTMHHFSSPKWLVSEGGWENEKTVGYFADYCRYVAERLGSRMEYVCTINEHDDAHGSEPAGWTEL